MVEAAFHSEITRRREWSASNPSTLIDAGVDFCSSWHGTHR
jgi:hypothetical protein